MYVEFSRCINFRAFSELVCICEIKTAKIQSLFVGLSASGKPGYEAIQLHAESFRGKWPTTSVPFITATAYRSCTFPGSLSHTTELFPNHRKLDVAINVVASDYAINSVGFHL